MIFDTHMHSELSSDSTMPLKDIIDASTALNIGVIITDHLDLNYPIKDEFRVDLPLFFEKYLPYKSDSLLLGVEIGLSSSILEENKLIAKSYPFDFIIGSVHAVNDEDIYSTYSKKGLSRKDYFENYFKAVITYITEFNDFDSLGHIDYPCRYCNFENNNFSLLDHGNYLKEIFSILISNNKALELNTRRLHLEDVYAKTLEIYSLYKKLGGKYITLGSDAHTKDAIAVNFNLALELCEKLELTPVYFKNRKPISLF